jgi:hypothetical protein
MNSDEARPRHSMFWPYAMAGLLFCLLVNGALPGLMVPTTGQLLWTSGFSHGFAESNSIYATRFGLPEPAPIAFGLSAALPIALLLKLGLSAVNAYPIAFAAWLSVAYYGAFQFVRALGGKPIISILLAILWLSSPIVWKHANYSMVSLGISLIPTYMYTTIKLLQDKETTPSAIALFFGATVASVFMDGYSYVMFFVGVIFAFFGWVLIGNDRSLLSATKKGLIVFISFAVSFGLYSYYIGRATYEVSQMEFFRAFGVNVEFLLAPTRGIHLVPDLLGLSVARSEKNYFGDASVWSTTFSLTIIAAAIYAFVTTNSSRNLKYALLGLAAFGFYMALGPSLKFGVQRPEGVGSLMPTEYATWQTGTEYLSTYVPGFQNMRASYRWVALGIFAAWALVALRAASNRSRGGFVVGVVLTCIAFNAPSAREITHYMKMRKDVKSIDKYVRNMKAHFKPQETVAFLPFQNDFLVNYMSGKVGIRTYNIGGDKNLSMAKESWPESMSSFKFDWVGPSFDYDVLQVLGSGDAQLVAIPFMNLLTAAHRWPFVRTNYERMRPVVDRLQSVPGVDVSETEMFAFVRLNEEYRDMPTSARLNALLRDRCRPGTCINKLNFDSGAKTLVGKRLDDGFKSDGVAGFLTFGPYATLNAGTFDFKLTGVSRQVEKAFVDIVSAGGTKVHATVPLISTGGLSGVMAEAQVVLSNEVEDLEIRVWVEAENDVYVREYEMAPPHVEH